VVLPEAVRPLLADHIGRVGQLHEADLRAGFGEVHIPEALARKYPNACREPGCHTLRNSYATHLLENGVNIRMVQELMGHADVKTTEIYTHVMNKDLNAVKSPLDTL